MPGYTTLCLYRKSVVVCPSPSPTPLPTATPTIAPTASPTPEPTATPTPEPTATPTIAPTASPTPAPTASPSPPPYGNVIWKAGDATIGRATSPPGYGQCGNDGVQNHGPQVSGSTYYFKITKNGTQCYRNQSLPLDSNGNTVYLTYGGVYTWTAETIDGDPNDDAPGMGPDYDAQAVWFQTHGTNDATPCFQLGFANTPPSSVGTPQQWIADGAQCSTGFGYAPFAEFSYTPQEIDYWVIQQKVAADSTGWTKVWRNGILVGSVNGPNVNPNQPKVFWNYGPYWWLLEQAGNKSSMPVKQFTVIGMTLYQQ